MPLVLGRKRGESIVIGEDIIITVHGWRGGHVQLVIDAPREVKVARAELLEPPATPRPRSPLLGSNPNAEQFAVEGTDTEAK